MTKLDVDSVTVCSLCNVDLEEDTTALAGYLGILPVKFCDTCYNSLEELFSRNTEPDDL